jgi:molybdate-binding protein/DNA-binding XRE family transcriptional regulator
MDHVEVKTNLAQLRSKRGFGASQLAAEVGVSRQTIYAIESGNYVPNTVVSLKLARVLDTTVEELFLLEQDQEVIEETAEVVILGERQSLPKGQPLRLARVNDQIVAIAPDPLSWGLQPTDAILTSPLHRAAGKMTGRVRVIGNGWKNPGRILLAGCDPSAALLAHSLERHGFELVLTYENSTRALELLQEGLIHIAGTHLVDSASKKSDLKPITSLFPRDSIAVLSYAIWKEGLLVKYGNPKKIKGIPDLVREDVQITNREPGAGCRRLLDEQLKIYGIAGNQISGYDRITHGQLPAARMVLNGEADACVGIQGAASSMGLGFLPLAEKPYLLVIRRSHLGLTPVEMLIETLGRAAYRREVEACVGYEMHDSGNRLV